jgi:hypothetical protein
MLQKLGQTNQKDYSMTAFNVVMTPSKFDIMYFKNSKRGLRVLVKDSFLFENIRAKSFVQLYASNQTKFFECFCHTISKITGFFFPSSLVARNFTLKVDKWNDRGTNSRPVHIIMQFPKQLS